MSRREDRSSPAPADSAQAPSVVAGEAAPPSTVRAQVSTRHITRHDGHDFRYNAEGFSFGDQPNAVDVTPEVYARLAADPHLQVKRLSPGAEPPPPAPSVLTIHESYELLHKELEKTQAELGRALAKIAQLEGEEDEDSDQPRPRAHGQRPFGPGMFAA